MEKSNSGSKILLIDSPYHQLYGSKKHLAFRRYFPLGLGYIAAFLIRKGFDVRLLVQSNRVNFEKQLIEQVNSFKPNVIGISSMTPAYPNAAKIAKLVKSLADAPVVIGGPHASACGEEILRECAEIDFVIFGEGELTFFQFCQNQLKKDKSCTDIQGLIWRDGDVIRRNTPQLVIEDVDTIPFPARELANMSNFAAHPHMSLGKGKSATMLTSRGCPSQCIFCGSKNIMGKRYRPHSAEYVTREMELLITKFGVSFIVIQDDTFTVDAGRLEQICSLVLKKGLKIKWNCFSRVMDIKPKMAALMYRAGCRIINFGIESGNDKIFQSLKKGGSLQWAQSAISACENAGIRTVASFIIGLPGESVRSYKDTVRFAKELKPTLAAFNPLIPFPGTQIWNDKFKPKNIDGWKRFMTLKKPPVSLTDNFTVEKINEYANSATLKFYLRPEQLVKILKSISSIGQLINYLRLGYAMIFDTSSDLKK